MIEVFQNGFVKVGEYYVQGMQRIVGNKYCSDPANQSSPSCTCPKGYERLDKGRGQSVWCDHKKAAYEYLKEMNIKLAV